MNNKTIKKRLYMLKKMEMLITLTWSLHIIYTYQITTLYPVNMSNYNMPI
jgi:hypothetical protein